MKTEQYNNANEQTLPAKGLDTLPQNVMRRCVQTLD